VIAVSKFSFIDGKNNYLEILCQKNHKRFSRLVKVRPISENGWPDFS
jgi:hypothetical protein